MIKAKHILFLAALLLIASASLSHFSGFAVARIIRSFCELLVTLALPSLALTEIINKRFKLHLDSWETITLAAAVGILIIPTANLVAIQLVRSTPLYLPYVISCAILITYVVYKRDSFSISETSGIKSYYILGAALLVYIVTSILIISSYQTLPDLDPYYWLQHTQQFNNQPSITLLPQRPLFYSLAYLFTKASHVDSYAFFKVVLPLISLLSLLPAWLLARTFVSRIRQTAILAIPALVPSTFLYQQMPMPQTLLILSSYFFMFLLLYSARRKLNWPYYAAGVIMALSYFYHEMAAPIFFVWLIVTIFSYRHEIRLYIKKNPLVILLTLLLFISNLRTGIVFYDISRQWMSRLLPFLVTLNPNIFFPAHYINIDGNSMGWPGLSGVTKYYLFYVGPPVVLLLLFIIYQMFSGIKWVKKLIKTKEYQVIFLSFLFFFVICEILPRVFNLALLPERSWIFAGIFISAAAPSLFSRQKLGVTFCTALIILSTVSVGGALFINYQKRYVIPDYQLASAQWIRKNLPSNRIIISSGNYNLLTFHANSLTMLTSPQFFCASADETEKRLKNLLVEYLPNRVRMRNNAVVSFLSDLDSYFDTVPYISINDIDNLTEKNFKQVIDYSESQDLRQLKQRIYVYYYHDDPRHPLLNRPYYVQAKELECPYNNFGKRDDMEMIYSDSNKVEIWKYK